MRYPNQDYKFWNKVSKDNLSADGCWVWKGRFTWNGYGQFDWTRKEPIGAHVAAYKLVFGEIPIFIGSRTDVSHSCDNRECVNPHHLIAQRHQTNVQEAFDKGRIRRDGKFNPNSKDYISNPLYPKNW